MTIQSLRSTDNVVIKIFSVDCLVGVSNLRGIQVIDQAVPTFTSSLEVFSNQATI